MSSTPFLPTKATIRSIIPLSAENHLFQLQLSDPQSMHDCQPGQFVELWVPGVGECPISVCSGSVDGIMELCIRQVGRVTSALFQKQEGDWIGLRGPNGTGFPIAEYKGKDLVLIAGGLGVAPIRSLWQYVLDNRHEFGKLIIIYGMRHSIDLLFRAEFKVLMRRRDIEVYIAAEEIEGPALPPISMQLGRVTDMLRLAPIDSNFQAAICGPPIMYKYAIQELKAKGITHNNIWLSLERHMKCGIGKCGHCFVGGSFTCRQGPVFQLSDLEFVPEAIECS